MLNFAGVGVLATDQHDLLIIFRNACGTASVAASDV